MKSDLILFCFTSMEGTEPGTSCTQSEDGTFQTLLKNRMHTVEDAHVQQRQSSGEKEEDSG